MVIVFAPAVVSLNVALGPEMTNHVKELFRLAGAPIDFETVEIDSEADYEAAVTAVRRNGVALKGNMTTNIDSPAMVRSKNVAMRTELDLFADIVHCVSMPGMKLRHEVSTDSKGSYFWLKNESNFVIFECDPSSPTSSLSSSSYSSPSPFHSRT